MCPATAYPLLFEPTEIRGLRLDNRIVYPPMKTVYDITTPRARAYYAERARNGAGLIIIESTRADEFDVTGYVDALRPLTETIHSAGSKVAIQLSASPVGLDGAAIAPSAKGDDRAATVEEIDWIQGKFARAAEGAKEAGFDAVELHGAHGYFFSQFFSPRANRRDDTYGGSRVARMRFALETVRRVRESVGAGFLILYRLDAVDVVPGGVTLADSGALAVALEKAGVDILDVSANRGGPSQGPSGLVETDPTAKFSGYAAALKPRVGIPVIAVGRIHQPATGENILANRGADLVAVGRQLLADPLWVRKAAEGRESEIVLCKSCNNCLACIGKGKPVVCSTNRRAGREYLEPL